MIEWCPDALEPSRPSFACFFKNLQDFRCRCIQFSLKSRQVVKEFNYTSDEFEKWHQNFGGPANTIKLGSEEKLKFQELFSFCANIEQNLLVMCDIDHNKGIQVSCSCKNDENRRKSALFLYNFEDVFSTIDIFPNDKFFISSLPPPTHYFINENNREHHEYINENVNAPNFILIILSFFFLIVLILIIFLYKDLKNNLMKRRSSRENNIDLENQNRSNL